MPPNFLAYIVILCFERRCSKQNTVARLKSNDLARQIISAGYATAPAVASGPLLVKFPLWLIPLVTTLVTTECF